MLSFIEESLIYFFSDTHISLEVKTISFFSCTLIFSIYSCITLRKTLPVISPHSLLEVFLQWVLMHSWGAFIVPAGGRGLEAEPSSPLSPSSLGQRLLFPIGQMMTHGSGSDGDCFSWFSDGVRCSWRVWLNRKTTGSSDGREGPEAFGGRPSGYKVRYNEMKESRMWRKKSIEEEMGRGAAVKTEEPSEQTAAARHYYSCLSCSIKLSQIFHQLYIYINTI